MGSRKDILKNLGIPEYPWSSDEDEPPTDPQPATLPRPNTGQQSTPASTSQRLFFSLLHTSPSITGSPAATAPNISSRRITRAAHTPAPEMMLRVGGERASDDIRRVLAFRRLTRNMNVGYRYTRNGLPDYTSTQSNSRPERVINLEQTDSAESNNTFGMRFHQWQPSLHRSSTVNTFTRPIVETPDLTADLAIPRRRRTQSMEVHNSDDEEPEEVESASRSGSVIVEPDDTPTEQETEADPQGTSNDTSGTGVSLEEEIVEIADEPNSSDLMTDGDPNLASTSRPDEVDAAEAETLQPRPQGVKRKRRSSSGDKPSDPFTVKEFNQSLLRLLECPVCLEWMEPPMSQCRRGHLVCGRCRTRLASCPVCRTTFSSVRNRAMEGVAEMLRYPCRHGCGREVRLRRRGPHEASCQARKYACPAPLCAEKNPFARDQLSNHFHTKHMHLLKVGARHRFGIKVNSEAHDNWLIIAMDEFFHMKVDVDIRTWGVIVYVSYIGPKCNAKNFAYKVTIDGQHNGRNMIYRRATHSDLESSSLNVSRQDCFHLTLDQALNFIRFKNRHCDAERFLEFDVEVSKIEPTPARDDSDS